MPDDSIPPGGPAGGPPVDLTNCDREPIHILGRVQSYGALVAVSADWIVQHASENLADVMGVEAEAALGRPLSEMIAADVFARIREGLSGAAREGGAARLFAVSLRRGEGLYDLSIHQSGRRVVLEFEPKGARHGRDLMADVYPRIQQLGRAPDMTALARDAARNLRAISGFDSVMVYRFLPDASGEVIAEDRADGQRTYLDLRFPASDIPVQARALYKRSLLRLIADVDDPGAPIVPQTDMEGRPLDLSLAVTRAVSPIHIEYLRNMGVKASMSVSIMKDGELWGLFACHHHSPRYIDYETRTAVEMFGHLFSYELGRREEAERERAQADVQRVQTLLMAHMAEGRSLSDSLLAASEDIERVIPHDGLVLYVDETFHATGATPTAEEFAGVARMLDRGADVRVFATDRLSRAYPPAEEFQSRCAGIMTIPVSKRPRDYLALCRREMAGAVNWAGDPNKPVTVGPNGTRLTPRKSFETWRETVRGRSAPWSDGERHAAELIRVVLLEIFLKVTDAAATQREQAHQQQQLLISELNHRVRNILNLMRSLVAQSRGGARTLAEFAHNLDGRIQSLSRAHDQLTREQWAPASLSELIRLEFDAYAGGKKERVVIAGPDAAISPKAYTAMALVLHEMATNSIKYGALCDNSGRVEVKLSVAANGDVVLNWREIGGPPVAPPTRKGFGSTIINHSVPHELRGEAKVDYKVTGVEAMFRIPVMHVHAAEETPEAPAAAAASGGAAGTAGFEGRALVLEDMLIIALDAAAILEELGAREVKVCASVAEALEAVTEGERFDYALLDVNLGEEQSTPVAEKLAELGVPFVLATGYGDAQEVAASFPKCPVVQKPFSSAAIREALTTAMEQIGRG